MTAVVVAVDIAAAVLQIRSDSRSDSARSEVTAGLNYQDDMSSIMQDTLSAETGARGYLRTGESSYLGPAKAAVAAAPAALRQIKAGSRGDPVLKRDYPKLLTLLGARLRDLVTSVDLYQHGHPA